MTAMRLHLHRYRLPLCIAAMGGGFAIDRVRTPFYPGLCQPEASIVALVELHMSLFPAMHIGMAASLLVLALIRRDLFRAVRHAALEMVVMGIGMNLACLVWLPLRRLVPDPAEAAAMFLVMVAGMTAASATLRLARLALGRGAATVPFGRMLRRPSAMNVLDRVTGTAFIGFGRKLAPSSAR